MAPGLYDETVAALGLRPDAGKHFTRLLAALLATDNAIAIRPPGLTMTESLTWRPVSDLSLTWRTSVVWPLPPANPAVPALGAALTEALVTHDQWR
jgi:hypothetical protein